MSKVESLKRLLKKVTGVNSNAQTVSKVLDDFAENYVPGSGSYKIVSYESVFATTEITTEVPINISQFDKDNDLLIVYINRLRAIPGSDYTISSDGNKIQLTQSLEASQVVNFLAVKVGGSNE